jgi:acyl-CoA synthetase (NDP forming)
LSIAEVRPTEWREQSAAIDALLSPRSVVLVGASERSRWSTALLSNLARHGFTGPVNLVNSKGSVVAGRTTARSCAELGEPADLGVVMVPAVAVPDAVAGLADAGARSAVVLTSGFAETGVEGAARQAQVVQAATGAGVTLLGPNSLGFINRSANIAAWATPIDLPSRRGGVAVVSQSGATAFFLAALAHQQDVALSHVVATGNEAVLDGGAIVRRLVEDPQVRAVAMFLESVRDPASFLDAAETAQAANVPLVVLKVGSSAATARSALAHTGALVGDDGVFDGVCQRYGIVRVRSMEELLTTADVIGRTGRLRPGGLGIVSNSGGVCEIAADTADALGLELPEIPPDTARRVGAALPGYGTPHNPLDLTGGIEPENAGDAVAMLGGAGAYSAVLVPFYPVPSSTEGLAERQKNLYRELSRGLRTSGVPGFLVSYTAGGLSADGRALVAELDIPYLACGLDRALSGLAGAFRWSQARPRPLPQPLPSAAPVGEPIAERDRPTSEREVMDLMRRAGVPAVPQHLVHDRASAVASAAELGGPVVLKIASADIGHKSDIGAVALRVQGAREVAAAFDRVLAAGRSQPGARVDGVLVSPMRESGTELFVGCTVDPVWGQVLAVGLGGVFVEVFSDVAVRPLPVTPAEVAQMLRGLRGARLLAGERGTVAADLDAVGRAVAALGDLAIRLGPKLAALDVNPLWVDGDQVEALDGLAVWRDAPIPPSADPSRVDSADRAG